MPILLLASFSVPHPLPWPFPQVDTILLALCLSPAGSGFRLHMSGLLAPAFLLPLITHLTDYSRVTITVYELVCMATWGVQRSVRSLKASPSAWGAFKGNEVCQGQICTCPSSSRKVLLAWRVQRWRSIPRCSKLCPSPRFQRRDMCSMQLSWITSGLHFLESWGTFY